MILLDTDHLSVLLDDREARQSVLEDRLRFADDAVGIPIATIEEQLRAWLAAVRRAENPHRQIVPYLRMKKVFTFLQGWPIVEWSEPAADQFVRLRKMRVRIGTQDLKVACIALANNALLLSANLRDFEQVPDLRVCE